MLQIIHFIRFSAECSASQYGTGKLLSIRILHESYG